MKICKDCKQMKDLNNYYACRKSYQSYCKECYKKRTKRDKIKRIYKDDIQREEGKEVKNAATPFISYFIDIATEFKTFDKYIYRSLSRRALTNSRDDLSKGEIVAIRKVWKSNEHEWIHPVKALLPNLR